MVLLTGEDASSADGGSDIGGVDPEQRCVAAELELALLRQLVDTDACDGAVLLVGDEHCTHAHAQRRLQHGQLLEHARQHGHVAQAVRHTATIQEVTLANQLERIALHERTGGRGQT